MPYTMTRGQAAARLLVRAYLDAHPGTTYSAVKAALGARSDVVRDAKLKTVHEWACIAAGARVSDARHAGTKVARQPVHRPATSASPPPWMMWHPGERRDEQFSKARSLGEGDDDWLPEPVDFDQDDPLEKAGLLAKKKTRKE